MRYLLVDEAAHIARCAPSTIRYWIRVGRLPSTRPGRRRLIRRDDLESFLEQPDHRPAGGPAAPTEGATS